MTAIQHEMALAAVGASLLDSLDDAAVSGGAWLDFGKFLDAVLTPWGSRWMTETFF